MDPGSDYNEQRRADNEKILRFEEQGEDLASSVAARKTNDLIERDERVRQNVAEQMNQDDPHYEDYEPPSRRSFTEQEWKEGNVDSPPRQEGRERGKGGRMYLTPEQWEQEDPEKFRGLNNAQLKEEFGTEYKMYEQARSRMSDPAGAKAAYDQPFIMEAARQEVTVGIREGRTDDEIRAGVKRPDQTGNSERQFRDRLRDVRQMRKAQEPRD